MKRGLLSFSITMMLLFYSAPSMGDGIITHIGKAQAIINRIKQGNSGIPDSIASIITKNSATEKAFKGGALDSDLFVLVFPDSSKVNRSTHENCSILIASLLLKNAKTDVEKAYAYGWALAHLPSDVKGHPLVNKYAGNEGHWGENEAAKWDYESSPFKGTNAFHVSTEWQFDGLTLDKFGYDKIEAPQGYILKSRLNLGIDIPIGFLRDTIREAYGDAGVPVDANLEGYGYVSEPGAVNLYAAELLMQAYLELRATVLKGSPRPQDTRFDQNFDESLAEIISWMKDPATYINRNYSLDDGTTHEGECQKMKVPIIRSGAGGDHSDDTAASSTLEISGDVSFEDWLRIGVKKGNRGVLLIWELKNKLDALKALPEDADPILRYQKEQELIGFVQANINNAGLIEAFRESNEATVEDLSTVEEVGILNNGFSKEMAILTAKVKEPTIRIPPGALLQSHKDKKVIIIPSGGFFGLEKSEVFKASLDEYVKQGGTLIVFGQQHGYEFSVLPVPQEEDGAYRRVGGYGWSEDQACQYASSYIDTWHQVLSGQSKSTPNINVDGYLTDYPSNATVLLRRTANGQPDLLMYEHGQGRVIVTSMYSDFALKQNHAFSEEIALIRDIISWAKKPDQLQEVKPGQSVTVSVLVTNNTPNNASSLRFLVFNPDRTTLLSEQNVSLSIPAGQSVTIPVTYTTTLGCALGIYHIDYTLYDSSGIMIQPQAEADSGRFVVSNPPKTGTPDKPIWFSVSTSSQEVLSGAPFEYTFHIFNNTNETRNLRIWNRLRHTFRGHEWSVVAAPNSETTLSGSDLFLDFRWMYETMDSRLYDEAGQEIGKYELSFKGIYPSVSISAKTDKVYYAKGEAVVISVSVKNNVAFSWQPNMKIIVADSKGATVFEDTKTLILAPSGTGTVSTSFTLPSTPLRGSYRVSVSGSSETLWWFGASTYATFEVAESRISVLPNLPSAFIAGNNTIPFTMANLGKINVSSGTIDLSLNDPHGSIIYSGSQPFSLAVGDTKTLAISISIPSLKLGNYVLTYSQSDETRTGNPTSIILTNSYSLNPSWDKPSYKIGGTANVTVSTTNTGKFVQEGSLTIEVPFLGFSETKPTTLNPSETVSIPCSLSLPLTFTQGGPVKLTLTFPSGDRIEKGIYLSVKPVRVEQKILLDRSSYRIRENLGINYIVTNDGNFAAPLNVNFILSIPDLSYTYEGSLVLDPAQTTEVPLVIPIPETLLPGLHNANVALALPWNPSLTKETGFVVPESSLILSYPGTSTPMAGDTISLLIENTGGVDTTYTTEKLSIIDSHGVEVYRGNVTGTILTGEKKPLVNIQIPVQVLNGPAYLHVQIRDSKTGKTFSFDKPMEITGVTSTLQTMTDKNAYLNTEAITGISTLLNGAYGIEGGSLKVSVNKISHTAKGQFTQFLPKGVYFSYPGGVAVGSDGSVYVADTENHRIQKFDSSGNFITRWGIQCISDSDWDGAPDQPCDGQFFEPWGIAVGPDGLVYVADSGNNRIQKLDSNGHFIAKWGSEGSGEGQFEYPIGISVASDGSVYVADTSNHRIQKFDSNGTFITEWGSNCAVDTNGDGVPDRACDGQFDYPEAIAVGPDGLVYVADDNHHIQKFDSSGNFITKWGSYCNTDSNGDGIPDQPCDGQFNYPYGIAIGLGGSVYVVDSNNSRIQKLDSNGHIITKWGSYCATDSNWDGVPDQPCDGQFNWPNGVAAGSDGSVYVADTTNHRIERFNGNGNFISKWGNVIQEGEGSGDGMFWRPEGVAVGPDGSIYVADTQMNRIQMFNNNGDFLNKWGSFGSEDGKFNMPKSMAVGPDGAVYIVDASNDRIQMFDRSGNFIMKWGSFGIGDGQFYSPYGIAVGQDGMVYVSDAGNARIQKFDSTGNFVSKWTHTLPEMQFNYPTGIAVGPDGSVYVADSWNFYVHKFDGNGNLITNWEIYGRCAGECDPLFGVAVGSDGSVYVTNLTDRGSLTAPAPLANGTNTTDYPVQKFDSNGNFITGWGGYGSGDGQFNYPEGIAIAQDGSIYVADTGNDRIQRIMTEDIVETLFETTLPINQPASVTQDYTTNVGTLSVTGKLQLQANLKNSLGETIAQAIYPFYIVDGNTVLLFNTDKKVYKPDETVTITGQVENRATIEAVDLTFTLTSKLSTQTPELLFTETFNTPAGGTHPFTITTTAGVEGTLTLTGEVSRNSSTLAEIADQYDVAKPNVSLAVSMPDVIGGEPFNINLVIRNTGKVDGNVQVGIQSLEFGDSQTITIPPGEIKFLQYSQQISKDTTYTFTLTGDLEQTLEQVVHFGERAEVQLTLPPSYQEGDIRIPYQLRNTGELQAAYLITFTLFKDGQEISRTTRTFTLPVNGSISDSLNYNLGEGSYILRFETSGFQAESQINVVKAAQGEITMAVNDFYPEGEILLPYTVKNIGSFDGEFTFGFELGTSLISKSAFIPAGGDDSGDLRFNLPFGNYTIKATLASQPSNSFSRSFWVARENNVQMAVALGTQTDGLIPVNVNLTNLGFNEFSGSVNVIVSPSTGQAVWNGVEPLSQLSPQSSQLVNFNINPSAILPGSYLLNAELLNNSNQVIAARSLEFGVQSANFQITQLPPYQTFPAGQEATFTFLVKNVGNQEGSFDLRFRAYDLIDLTQRQWLKPNEEKNISFGFPLPEDLEEKDYFASYELKAQGSKVTGVSGGQIKYHLAGISLNVNASLDKPYYTERETAHLTINIQTSNPAPQNLFARVNYAGYEPQQIFTLSGNQVLIFDIPLPKITGEKLFYGIYHEGGRSIHLNSVYIHKAGDVIAITTDKQVYQPRDIVSVSVSGNASGNMTLSGPGGYAETFTFTGSATKSFTLPATITAGTYFTNVQLITQNSSLITTVYPFDVAGIQVKVLECNNDKGKYASSDNITTNFTISSNTTLPVILKAWIVDPVGQYASVGEQNITLSSSESSPITYNSALSTSVSGIHHLVYGIYGPEDLLLCSGSEAFDVGDAVLLGISTDKVDYPQGNESVVIKAGLYGSVTASLEFYLDGQSVGSQSVSLNGFSTLDYILPSVASGPHALKVALTAGGLTSTKEATFTYGGGLPDLTLRLSWDQVVGQSSINLTIAAINQGKSPSGATTLHLFDGEISGGRLLTTFDIPTLSQGQSQTLTHEINLLGRAGANTLSGVIDPSNTVYEFNESNNADQITFTVPEVTLSTTLEKDSYFTGEAVPITSLIANLSKDALAGLILSTEVKDQAEVQVFTTTQNIPRIEAMATTNLLTNWSPDPNLPEGVYTIRQSILGKEIRTQKNLTFIPGKDFTITTDVAIKKTELGEVAEYHVQLTPLKAFKGEISLSLSGYPQNSTAYFTPNPVTITEGQAQSILTVIPSNQACAGSYSMKVNATGGGMSHDLDLLLNLTDFEMTLHPTSQTLPQIEKTNYTVTLNPLNGFDHGVTLEVNDIPPGMRASLSAKEVILPQSVTLTLETSKWLLPGEYRIPIVGKARTLTHTLTAILIIQRNPLNVPGIVTVPGLLNKPVIHAFSPSGGLLSEFQVVDGGLGVNISAGDVDGDGVDEVIAGTGWKLFKMGRVEVFRRDGTQVALMETEQGYVTDLTVAAGDFDGDWIEEVVLGLYKSPLSDPLHGGGGVKVYKVMGNRFIDTGLLLLPYESEGYFGPPNLTVSDVDGDGVPELITAPGPDPWAPAKIKVFKIDTSAGVGQWRLGSQIMDFIVPFNVNGFGAHVTAGDLDGDDRAEIIVGAGPDPRKKAEVVIVYHRNGGYQFERFTAYPGLLFGVNIAAMDVDGDGISEILTGPGPDPRSKSKVRIFRRDGTLIREFQAYPDNIRFGVKVSTGRIGE